MVLSVHVFLNFKREHDTVVTHVAAQLDYTTCVHVGVVSTKAMVHYYIL